MRRTHPFHILVFVKRFLPLLILPLLRGFILALQGNLYFWLRGAWFDILIITLIFLLSYTRWYFIKYKFDKNSFTVVSGLINRKRVHIPACNVTSLFIEQPLIYRLFRVAKVSAESLSMTKRGFDINLILGKKEAFSIMENRQRYLHDEEYKTVYMPRPVYITILALLTSNSFSGIVLFFALMSQLFGFFGDQLRTYVLTEFQSLMNLIDVGVPPVLNLLTWIIIVGYAFGFITNFLNHKDFIIKKGASTLYINSGFTTLSDYSIHLHEIHAIDIRQNLLSKLFHLYTVQIQTAGYGAKGTKLPILIPAARYSDLLLILEDLFPELLPSYPEVQPQKKSILKYIGFPIFLYNVSFSSFFILKIIFPHWGKLIPFITALLFILSSWVFAIRLFDFHTAGIAKSKHSYTCNYSKKLILHSVIFPMDKLSYLSFRQTPMQRHSGRTDLLFYTFSVKKLQHRVRDLALRESQAFFD